MAARITVAAANVLYTLSAGDAARRSPTCSLGCPTSSASRSGPLAHSPAPRDWAVALWPGPVFRRFGAAAGPESTFGTCLCWAGVSWVRERTGWSFAHVAPFHSVLLDAPIERTGYFDLGPPRIVNGGVYRATHLGRTVALVDYHLVVRRAGAGRYRSDRPRLVERHRREVRRLARLVTHLMTAEHVVHAVGDSNYGGLRLPRLTSAWEGPSRRRARWIRSGTWMTSTVLGSLRLSPRCRHRPTIARSSYDEP